MPDRLFLCASNYSTIPFVKEVASSIVPKQNVLSLDDILKVNSLNLGDANGCNAIKFIPNVGWGVCEDGDFTPLNLDDYPLPSEISHQILAQQTRVFEKMIHEIMLNEESGNPPTNLIFVGLLGFASRAKKEGLEVVYIDTDRNSRLDIRTAASVDVFIKGYETRSNNFLAKEMLNELTSRQEMVQVGKHMKALIDKGEIRITRFDLHANWPHHPLIIDIRRRLTPIVNGIFQDYPFIDPQDLIHQILFRLTTYSPRDIYNNKVMSRLKEDMGTLDDPETIVRMDAEFLQNQQINWDLVGEVIEEQRILLEKKYSGKGSIYDCFKKRDMFTLDEEKRWSLHRRDGKIFARSPLGEEREVFFELVDNQLAHYITEKYHYIHAARSEGYSFGLRIEGEEVPFAIETVEPTSNAREIKQKAWLSKGFNPLRGFELTRLYTFPGGPRNIIGILDRLVPNALLKMHPLTEFISTTVMPTYASTRSTTIAGGIDDVALARIRPHNFIPCKINNKICLEQVTNRRLDGRGTEEIVKSNPEFPLLPTLEVVMAINKRSFSKILDKGEAIFVDER